MPRYIKKHKKSYTTEDLAAAKDGVKAGNVSRYTVASVARLAQLVLN